MHLCLVLQFVPQILLQRCERLGARGARTVLRYVTADRSSITGRVNRVKWRLCRRIGRPQHDIGKGRMSPAEKSFRESVGNPSQDFSPTPPRGSYYDRETKGQSYITCPNHQVCPNTVPSQVYAALAPLSTYLPVNPCVPVLATLTLPYFVVFWTIAWLQAIS